VEVPVEGLLMGLRRKSVRMSVVAMGCGSLMLPNDDSERLLVDERRWAPRAQTEAIVRSTPKTNPGKKPERTAATGNLAQFA
jgi:hypothetical protein